MLQPEANCSESRKTNSQPLLLLPRPRIVFGGPTGKSKEMEDITSIIHDLKRMRKRQASPSSFSSFSFPFLVNFFSQWMRISAAD
jgi:hypothetical protein